MIRKKINEKINGAIYSINAAALLIGAASLLSRILGVLRDRLLASHFGASRELDIYYAAFQIPDFMFNLFLLGAAGSAIIPIFLETKEKSPDESKRLVANLLKLFLMVTLAVSALMLVLMPYLVRFITPGFSVAEKDLVVTLARIMMASPVFLGLSSIIAAVNQSFRRFFVFALSPVLYNLGIIFGILVFLPIFGLPGLAMGVIFGAFMHFLAQSFSFIKLGFGFTNKTGQSVSFFGAFSKPLRKILILSFPRVIAVSIGNITNIFLIAAGSTLARGSISVFKFADNLSGLPIGIFGVSFAVAAFPSLSEHFMKKNRTEFFDSFYASIRSVLFWVLPLAILFYVLRAQIVRVALGAGKFDWQDTRLTAAFLGIMAISIVANSIIPILIRSFYAIGNTRRPLLINVFTSLITVILSFFFINLLEGVNFFSRSVRFLLKLEGVDRIAILGVALAISLGSLSDLALLYVGSVKEARLKLQNVSGNESKILWREVSKMLLSALIAGITGFISLRAVNRFVSLDTFWGVFAQGGIAFAVGAFFYAALLYIFGNKEITRLAAVLKNKMVRTKILPAELDGENIK